mgnify:CR=1 FL=1|jgi:hypothetical protein|tara:strand:- start:3485 stop:4195 length:711 start_codon:yes stop_codon:yes gene_type:complete
MVVGTVFIMVFGMATVTMVESIDESVKNSEYELPGPQVDILSVTDKQESTGPIATIGWTGGVNLGGSDYVHLATCDLVSSSSGTGATVQILDLVDDDGEVDGYFPSSLVPGNGYAIGEVVTIDCGSDGSSGTATYTITNIQEQNTLTIRNTGSETVDLSHIFLTLTDTGTKVQGTPFTPFINHYSGNNLYLFPGEQLSTDTFPLDPTIHGFAIDTDPDRAFLAIYDYNDAETVTIT